MIDEKKLIEKIERMRHIVSKYSLDAAYACENLLCELKDYINDQPRVGGWIPVSERLPNECVEVLITATSPDGYIYTTTTWYQEKRWVMRHRADKVIAWQPLPEPYKESEGE